VLPQQAHSGKCANFIVWPRILHLIVTFTSICHVPSNIHILFPVLPHFWSKNINHNLQRNPYKWKPFINDWHSTGLQASNWWLVTKNTKALLTYYPPRSSHCCHLSGNCWIVAAYQSLEIMCTELWTPFSRSLQVGYFLPGWFFHFVEQSIVWWGQIWRIWWIW